LCKSYEFAWTCLDNYESTFKDENVPDYETSELFMYKASIMEEAGKFEEALDCVKTHDKEIVDKLGLNEMKARINMFLCRFDEAAELYRKLVGVNPENHQYVLGYMANQPKFQRFWPPLPPPQGANSSSTTADVPSSICSFPQSTHPEAMPVWGWLAPEHAIKPNTRYAIGCRQHKRRIDTYQPMTTLTDEEEDAVIQFFDELESAHPKSDALQRLILFFLAGARFEKRCDLFLRKRIRKGIPSLFKMIRPLYFQDGKAAIVEKLLHQYVKCLQEEIAWFGPVLGEDAKTPTYDEEEAPSCYLFSLMVLGEHYDFMGFTEKAIEYTDQAITHTPTFVEIYSSKARIYKHAGDFESSARCFDEVRQMDLADRFLNTQCVRALLRVDDVQQGMEKALLFSKEPDSPEAANLHDMQCMWYESAVGRSYTRQKNYGKALKKFSETFKHFNDIAEDQFDFHNYCLRKTTLKTYVAMLRMQERLYSHKFYRRAAKDAIRIYLELFDMAKRGEGPLKKSTDAPEEELSAEEKKKLKHKKKREEKAKQEEAAKKAAIAPGAKPKKIDEDPEGEKLLEKDPMEEACKLCKALVQSCRNDTATHILTYDIMSRQGKLLQCLQALIKLWELIGKELVHYKIIAPLAHFCFVADIDNKDMPAAVKEVIMCELSPVLAPELDGKPFDSVATLRASATKIVDKVEKRLKESNTMPLAEVLYSLQCLKHAGRDMKSFLESWKPEGAFSLKECKKLLAYFGKEYGLDSSVYSRFKSRCMEIFPLLVLK
jgi:peptide alpha-N-acetyltransferase